MRLARHNKGAPGAHPERIDHGKPPAHHLIELFEAGKCRDSYVKERDATRILRNRDLMVSIGKCPELKAFVNTIITICGAEQLR